MILHSWGVRNSLDWRAGTEARIVRIPRERDAGKGDTKDHLDVDVDIAGNGFAVALELAKHGLEVGNDLVDLKSACAAHDFGVATAVPAKRMKHRLGPQSLRESEAGRKRVALPDDLAMCFAAAEGLSSYSVDFPDASRILQPRDKRAHYFHFDYGHIAGKHGKRPVLLLQPAETETQILSHLVLLAFAGVLKGEDMDVVVAVGAMLVLPPICHGILETSVSDGRNVAVPRISSRWE